MFNSNSDKIREQQQQIAIAGITASLATTIANAQPKSADRLAAMAKAIQALGIQPGTLKHVEIAWVNIDGELLPTLKLSTTNDKDHVITQLES
jgi:5-enolpyruvylshikimate-3-phosphate synthase